MDIIWVEGKYGEDVQYVDYGVEYQNANGVFICHVHDYIKSDIFCLISDETTCIERLPKPKPWMKEPYWQAYYNKKSYD